MAVLYSKVDWIYLKTEKAKAWCFNYTTHLRIKSQYYAAEQELNSIKETLHSALKAHGGEVDIKTTGAYRHVLTFHEIVFEIKSAGAFEPALGEDNRFPLDVSLEIQMATPYRKAINFFDTVISPLLEKIDKNVSDERRIYTMEVDFKGKDNPFFGLYVKRLSPSETFRWNYERNLRTSGGLIQISRGKIFIRSNSLTQFGNQSRNYFSLSGSFPS
jgi:hypothetical protein